MSAPQTINEIWAWVVTEADGSEGVPAASGILPGYFIPLMGADEARVRSYEPCARLIAELKGLPIKLVRFSQAEVVG